MADPKSTPPDAGPDTVPDAPSPVAVDPAPQPAAPAEPAGAGPREYVIVAAHPIDLPDGRQGLPGQPVTLTPDAAAGLLADGHLAAH